MILRGFLLLFLATFFFSNQGSTHRPSPKLKTVKVALEWVLNPHHAPLVLGITKGFFKEEGLTVELINSPGSLEGCLRADAGLVDFALTHEPQWIIQNDKGLNLIGVMTLIPEPLEVFISRVPKDQLKGKRIGHSSSGLGFSATVLNHILQSQGLKTQDVELIHTKYALLPTLLTGQVDAIINAYRTSLMDLGQDREKFYVYSYESLNVPLFSAQVIVAHAKLDSNLIESFKRALVKSCDFLTDNPEQAWQDFSSYRRELNIPENKALWPEVIKVFKACPLPADQARYQKLRQFLYDHKLIGILNNSRF